MVQRRSTGRRSLRACLPVESALARNTPSVSASPTTPTISCGRIPLRIRRKPPIPTPIRCRICRLSLRPPSGRLPTAAFPIPLFPAQATSARRSRRVFRTRAMRWIALTVVVAIAGVMAYAWITAQQNGSPISAVTQFCSALRGDKYSQAYSLLNSATRNRISIHPVHHRGSCARPHRGGASPPARRSPIARCKSASTLRPSTLR